MANLAKPKKTRRFERFNHWIRSGSTKLERSRYMSSLTIPSLLPY